MLRNWDLCRTAIKSYLELQIICLSGFQGRYDRASDIPEERKNKNIVRLGT